MATTARAAATRPAAFPGAFSYEHADIPSGITIAAYHRERAAQRKHEAAMRRVARRQAAVRAAGSPVRAVLSRALGWRRLEAGR